MKNGEQSRKKSGVLTGIVGIILNIFLFCGKIVVGTISGAISITADAFNNLSDAGSSVISLLGFFMADKKPDKEHPFGHGRMEYIAGLFVSVLIILMGFELAKSSIDKILHPSAVEWSNALVIVLVASVVIKLIMFGYNRYFGRKIDSATLIAASIDSVSDSIATTVVLLSLIIAKYFGVMIDGYAGLAVSAFILFAGIRSIKETIDPLLGRRPDAEFVMKIKETVLSFDQIIGIHDLIVHDYGPGERMVSLHGEVSQDSDLVQIHEVIDACERRIREELDCEVVIHMDPIADNDEETLTHKAKVAEIVKEYNSAITIHDFRMVNGTERKNLVFDAVVPIGLKESDDDIKKGLSDLITGRMPGCYPVIDIDREYTEIM